jgi:hypothetical protein
VLGGGDTAMEEATFLTRFTRSVTVVHRRSALRASQVMQNRTFADDKVSFAFDSEIAEIKEADGKLAGVVLRDVVTGQTRDLHMTGLFIAIGHDPRTELFKGRPELERCPVVSGGAHCYWRSIVSGKRIIAVGRRDAGISAALRARELDPDSEFMVVVADVYPNFSICSICGIPYYVSGEVTRWSNLAHRTAEDHKATGMHVRTNALATTIDVPARPSPSATRTATSRTSATMR